MPDNEKDGSCDSTEELSLKHKAEKKELQSKIQALKRGIPKGDKKKNKEVKAQIAILESELSEKHEKELKELTGRLKNSSHDFEVAATENVDDTSVQNTPQRVSKAMRKREKKSQKTKEQAEIAAQAEEDYLNTKRYAEEQKITQLLSELSLEVKPMVSDGNCLYYAIEDQLKSPCYSCEDLRRQTSEFMLSHPDDFLPFLTSPDTGDCLTSEEFQKYCDDVRDTTAWGGQLELRALSHVLRKPIHVIQADVPIVKIGEEYCETPIILTYHRHELGLGEHYNSVAPLKDPNNENR